jgi:hypothetical protein
MAHREGRLRVSDPLVGRFDVEGDGFAAAGELVSLIVSPEVQRALRLTDKETAAAKGIVSEYRTSMERAHAGGQPSPATTAAIRQVAAEALRTALGAGTFDGLQRLSWRIQGGEALLDPFVIERLNLSAAQRQAIAEIAAENERARREALTVFSRARLANLDPMRTEAAAGEATGAARLIEVLTPQQRVRFDELQDVDARGPEGPEHA